jgi:hypothetical protein
MMELVVVVSVVEEETSVVEEEKSVVEEETSVVEEETSVWDLVRGDGVSKGGLATGEGREGEGWGQGGQGGEGGERGPWSGVWLDLQFIKQKISLFCTCTKIFFFYRCLRQIGGFHAPPFESLAILDCFIHVY